MEFAAQLQIEGLAPRSIVAYARMVIRAEAWCEAHGTSLRLAPATVIAAWAATLPMTTATRRQARTALDHYWRLRRRRDPPLWTIRVPRKARGVCRALEVDEAARLAKTARARSDAAGLATLFALHLALRRFEIAKLRWADFDDAGWLMIVGKNEQTAMLPVHPHVLEAMTQLGRRGRSPYLFPSRDLRSHAAPATVWNWVRAVAADAGVDNVAPHRLRHTALATANDATGDLRAVQEFARHARPETTALYTRTTAKRLTAVMQAIDYDAVPE